MTDLDKMFTGKSNVQPLTLTKWNREIETYSLIT